MKELVNKLNEARKAYYFGEQSPLSDREYLQSYNPVFPSSYLLLLFLFDTGL